MLPLVQMENPGRSRMYSELPIILILIISSGVSTAYF